MSDKLPTNYEFWSALSKRAYLWDAIMLSKYSKLPSLNTLGVCRLVKSGFAFLTLGKSFDYISDEIPAGRIKALHPFGSVAQVKFVSSDNHPYTGLFKGATGLARISLAGPPFLIGVTPGLAIKFFIRGQPSANIHVMHSLDGQGANHNVFAHPFSNILSQPEGFGLKLLEKWFSLFKTDPRHLPLHHLAVYNEEGQRVVNPVAPYQIVLEASQGMREDTSDFRTELAKIPAESPLYEVWAAESQDDDTPRCIGRLITDSEFVTSRYGDETLFFKHQR